MSVLSRWARNSSLENNDASRRLARAKGFEIMNLHCSTAIGIGIGIDIGMELRKRYQMVTHVSLDRDYFHL